MYYFFLFRDLHLYAGTGAVPRSQNRSPLGTPGVRATRSVAARLNSLLPATPEGRRLIVPEPSVEEEMEDVSLLDEEGGGGDQGGSAEW